MTFSELQEKQCFTWWDVEHHRTGVKVGDRQAFCFDTLCLVNIPSNKTVKDVEGIPADVQLFLGRNGQAYLGTPTADGKVLARRIILIGGEIMDRLDVKKPKPPVTGEGAEHWCQLYLK